MLSRCTHALLLLPVHINRLADIEEGTHNFFMFHRHSFPTIHWLQRAQSQNIYEYLPTHTHSKHYFNFRFVRRAGAANHRQTMHFYPVK